MTKKQTDDQIQPPPDPPRPVPLMTEGPPPDFVVRGRVALEDGTALAEVVVHAYNAALRGRRPLGHDTTDEAGEFEIGCSHKQLRRTDKDPVAIVIDVLDTGGALLASAPVPFDPPAPSNVDVIVPATKRKPATLIEKVHRTIAPWLAGTRVEDLEEDDTHQDVTFLAGRTGLEKPLIARFVVAHRLVDAGIETAFWFALLDGSLFEFAEDSSLKTQAAASRESLASLDAAAIRKSVSRAIDRRDIPEVPAEQLSEWIDALVSLAARRSVADTADPSFVRRALDDAGIKVTDSQERFSRLLSQHKRFTPALVDELANDESFAPDQIADLRTSFQLSDVTNGDFAAVKYLKDRFNIRRPEQVRILARKTRDEWAELAASQMSPEEAKEFGAARERQFREAFPTTAFAAGLDRAMRNGGSRGLRKPQDVSRFLERHEDFELLRTPVDEYLKHNIQPDLQSLAEDEEFRRELKSVQRAFKLAPRFDAVETLLADDLHSAQKIYRMGETEFVRSYGERPGFTEESARKAWLDAEDTYATVITIVTDLKSLDPEAVPAAIKSNTDALATFPNWNNLFKGGDLCECEPCRSALSPAAYFADLLNFLKDRKTTTAPPPAGVKVPSLKDILFARRPDLGFLELTCANALKPLPYIDVVNEVLEVAVDAAHGNDLELVFTPGGPAAMRGLVRTALNDAFALAANDRKEKIALGDGFTVSQVDPDDPDRWVVHGDNVTYLFTTTAAPDYRAQILPNTKASAAELRAYPQYVNPMAYETLRAASYPATLPFDLFAEEVRSAFKKTELQRWDLMRTLRGRTAPNNPTPEDVAAEYFGISADAAAASDERRLILEADPTDAGQRLRWGVSGTNWLVSVSVVRTFLQKTGLEYEQLLALLDLRFINPARDISVVDLDQSCDTDKKVIGVLDPAKLDRIYRFLRLWRKLKGWQMWELDLVIEHQRIGAGALDEPFLVQLFALCLLKKRLGDQATVEQICGLFGDLNTWGAFTRTNERRGAALYQSVFLNTRLIHPMDSTFEIDPATNGIRPIVDPVTTLITQHRLADHRPAMLAALGIRESDLAVLEGLTRASGGAAYINGDLTLANLSFLWRHAWLLRVLNYKAYEWKTLLGLLGQDVDAFASPDAARTFIEQVDRVRASGFAPDQLSWLLAADRTAKAAPKEADAVRFLAALRRDLLAIQSDYDRTSPQHAFLAAPRDEEQPAVLLTRLLQQLNRSEADASAFIKTLRGPVVLETGVEDLPPGFTFPAAITAAFIPIQYDQLARTLRFTGVMTEPQRSALIGNALSANVTSNPSYAAAIADLFQRSQSAADRFVSVHVSATLPAGLTPPADRPSLPIRFTAATQTLAFTGVMTDAERTALTTAGYPAAAVTELFLHPRLAIRFFEPVFTAALESLPPAVDLATQLSPSLASKVSYDADQRLLRFASIMGDADQAAINALVGNVLPSDVAFRNAVASLRNQPRTAALPDERIWLTDVDLDATQPASNTLAKRLANAATKALAYLSRTLTEAAVVEQCSAQLGLPAELVRRLLTAYAIVPITPAPAPPEPATTSLLALLASRFQLDAATINAWFWAMRVADIWKKWKVTLGDVDRLRALTAGANAPQLLDFLTLPLASGGTIASVDRLASTSSLIRLQASLPGTELTLLDVLQKLNAGTYASLAGPAATARQLFAADVQRLNDVWLSADVEALVDALDRTYPTDYLRAETWERVRLAFYFLESLNAGVGAVQPFAASTMTLAHAKAIKELLRSKFGSETWLLLSAEIQDVLRERKRDALAAYLLSRPQPTDAPTGKWENTNDLYAYYLLDVEMASCQLTSRLVQGSGCIQLFVQRCLMGLEPDVVVETGGRRGDNAWHWWTWMRKYRVWEANRKVFLWPENWIEPELKKDKSDFFKDLENELLQNDVSQRTVESALSNYLQKLDGVAQLEVAALHHEDDGTSAILHVFGRTPGAEPHRYFYRRYDYRQWTPWERVDLDIQGDYLIPAVVNTRVFLFWPVFTEVPGGAGNARMTMPSPGDKRFTPDKSAKRLRLQMAMSEYRQGQWTPQKVSRDTSESEIYFGEIDRRHYHFNFIDNPNGDGRCGIMYEGFSVDAKTFDDVKAIANDAAAEETSAKQANDAALLALTEVRKAIPLLQAAMFQTELLVIVAHTLLATAENSAKNAGDVYSLILGFRGNAFIASPAYISAGAAVAAVKKAAGANSDAAFDTQAFMDAVGTLDWSFRALEAPLGPQPGGNLGNPGKDVVIPLAKTAHNNAKAAFEAGTEAVRTLTAFKDAVAGDAQSTSKELRKATAAAKTARDAEANFTPDTSRKAELSGVFELSGASGVPEKGKFLRAMTPSLRPNASEVGYYAAFQKWVERTGQDEFTLVKYLPPTSLPTLPNGVVSAPVLDKTPSPFKVSPGWHLSYFDRLWSSGKVGILLPFFYSDKQRTFFVRPVVWSAEVYELHTVLGNAICTYPEIRRAISKLEAIPQADMRTVLNKLITYQMFDFETFYHPHARAFARLVANPVLGIPALMSRENQLRDTGFTFLGDYGPKDAVLGPNAPIYYPTEQVDFTPDGAYAPYNWELFFHVPLLIANSLSRNQRFEEARNWYHFIFNPIGMESPAPGGSPMSKYWITKPFFQTTDPQYVQQRIDNLMRMLAGDTTLQNYSDQARKDLESQVLDWRTNPFEPHRIANYRTVAYQKTVVMKYLDNLIAWGDYLFRQDSMESVKEATQLYILAAEILGPRPRRIPPRARPAAESFNELESQFDAFSNAMVEVENLVPQPGGQGQPSFQLAKSSLASATPGAPPLPMLYFCIPQNDKMLAYWDTVADRLYKLRHCMNLEGVTRQLALFEPPIDPAALVKAVAGGVDIGSALADLNAPLPLYRFTTVLQKANEVCNDIKALGGALLSALEKKDAEAVGRLRQDQELRLLDAVKAVRQQQIDEALENLAGLKRSKEQITIRHHYYRDIEKVSASETLHQNKLELALVAQQNSQALNIAASIAHAVPSFDIGASGVGGSPKATVMFGGPNIGSSMQATGGALTMWANAENHAANKALTNAGHERRWQEWKLQERLADKELQQVDKTIAAAELRLAIARKELDNQVLQIENAKAMDAFMRSKYTNDELYQWHVGQISSVYFQSYKLAYDLAKRAERCFRFELGLADSSYISFGYWDSLKKGLASGDRLQYDLRRLEAAYLDRNRREFELSKHISLAMVDPLALVKLRETGRCFVRLPEELFDLDYPGHYFRRIKSVSLTLPCVVGPYTTISCTLRLVKNSIRINTANGLNADAYSRNTVDGLPADDARFVESSIPVKAIAASSAQNDSGLFELNFRDERYLPFEGAGVVSEWVLELFNDAGPDFGRPLRQFDYNTISDAILQIKYTAREDTGPFKSAAVAHLRAYFTQPEGTPSVRMINIRQEFPTEWYTFLHPANAGQPNVLDVEMSPRLFPLRDSGKTLKINSLTLLARCSDAGAYTVVLSPPLPAPPAVPAVDPNRMRLAKLAQFGGLHVSRVDVSALTQPIRVSPTDPPIKWRLTMTRPGGGNLVEDPVARVMEVEEALLVLGYEWE